MCGPTGRVTGRAPHRGRNRITRVAASTGTATIVFTDLVGSTALRSRLGEQAADDLRREHDAALADVVETHRGRVVKGAGDGIMAAFDSASDAVVASVAMQRAVVAMGRRRRLELAIRVRISAGDVSWENGDCFGLPVVEAARLEASAGPGQILAAELIRVLARGRAQFDTDAPAAQCAVRSRRRRRSDGRTGPTRRRI
jgi:class 3 adenylate cyclase